jgi:hypothetical protein
MRADQAFGRGARHVTGIGLQALLVAAIIATVALAMSAIYKPAGFVAGVDDAAAAKGGKPALAANGSLIGLAGGSELWLGGTVRFVSEAVGLKGGEYPMVVVKCWAAGGDLVYAQLDHPGEGFVLGGGSSDWKSQGGSASCEATLHAYGGKSGGNDTIRLLAGPLGFRADG